MPKYTAPLNIEYDDGKSVEQVRKELEAAINDLQLAGIERDKKIAQLEQDMISMQSAIAAKQTYQQTGGGSGGNGTTLLEFSDLTYQGSFRVPYSYPSNQVADYGGYGGMWYDSSAGTLYLTASVTTVGIGWFEVSIPTLVDISAAAISTANTGTLQQSHGISLGDIPNQVLDNAENIKAGGMFIDGGNFYAGLFEYYDGNGDASKAWIKLNSTTLSSATITGEFKIGSLPPAFTARSVLDIPSGKQTKMGGYTHACSTIAGPIIGRYSSCPSFVAFTPSDIGVTEPTDSGNYLYRFLGDGLGTGYDLVSHVGGGFIPDGTNCVIYFGDKALTGTTVGYGEQADYNDYNRSGKGYHAQDGLYTFCYWAYDLDDLESVKNGTLSYAAVTPYAYGDINLPQQVNSRLIGGVAYDRTNKKVYVSTVENDNGTYERLPLIHCYSHA